MDYCYDPDWMPVDPLIITEPPTTEPPTTPVPVLATITNNARWFDNNGIEISANDGGHVYKFGNQYFLVGNDLFQAENGMDIHMYSSKTLGTGDWYHEGMCKPTMFFHFSNFAQCTNSIVHIVHLSLLKKVKWLILIQEHTMAM